MHRHWSRIHALRGRTLVLVLIFLLGLAWVEQRTLAPFESVKPSFADEAPAPLLQQKYRVVDSRAEQAGLPNVEAFFDTFFAEQLQESYIPGAVVAVVHEGDLVLAKGYGYADLARQKPVNPETTKFRVASISKPFTAVAVMQLHERGVLDLHRDVNDYLTDFRLPYTLRGQVTLKQLLTHTAGFDEQYTGLTRRGTLPMSLESYLAENLPPRVLPSGEVFSYSNYGYTLAGHVVEEVSGVPFAEYMDANVLQPLGMQQSSFGPAPVEVSDLAVGYEYVGGRYRPVPVEQINVGPAAGLHTTATDMARFMIALLQLGRYEDARILEARSVRELQQQQFTNDPRLPGFTYAFFEQYENNRRVLSHEGIWRGFTSQVLLLPEHDVGVFVSYNRLKRRPLSLLTHRFLDRYYPPQPSDALTQSSVEMQPSFADYAGTYRSVRYPRHTPYKLWAALTGLSPEFRITADEDAALTLHYPGKPQKSTRWVEVESLLFQQVGGDSSIAFRQGSDGRIAYMFSRAVALERVPWYETITFHLGLLGLFVLVFASACGVWIQDTRRGTTERTAAERIHAVRLTRTLSSLVAFLNLVFLGGLGLLFRHFDLWTFAAGLPKPLTVLLVVPLLTSTLALVGLPLCTFWIWRHRDWSTGVRLYYTVVTLTALLFIPFLRYWNLLGFHF